jgi:hypothetical protein
MDTRALLGVLTAAGLVVLCLLLLNGFVFAKLWNWFMPVIFGLPPIGIAAREPSGAAQDLCTCAAEPGVTENPHNRAIWQYLAAVPPTTRVALFWH